VVCAGRGATPGAATVRGFQTAVCLHARRAAIAIEVKLAVRHFLFRAAAARTERLLLNRDEAMAAPAHAGKPGTRTDHRRCRRRRRDRVPPPVEPRRRRARIQIGLSPAVLPAVHQHEPDTLHTKPIVGSSTTGGIRGTGERLRSAWVNATRACCAVIARAAMTTQDFCPLGCSMPRPARRCESRQPPRARSPPWTRWPGF